MSFNLLYISHSFDALLGFRCSTNIATGSNWWIWLFILFYFISLYSKCVHLYFGMNERGRKKDQEKLQIVSKSISLLLVEIFVFGFSTSILCFSLRFSAHTYTCMALHDDNHTIMQYETETVLFYLKSLRCTSWLIHK